MKKALRFAVCGAGFWSHYQLNGWRELGREVKCVAVYNRTKKKAEALAAKFGIPAVYDDPKELFAREKLDRRHHEREHHPRHDHNGNKSAAECVFGILHRQPLPHARPEQCRDVGEENKPSK